MPMVRISDRAIKRLASWAEPPGGGVESAIDRALDAAERGQGLPAQRLRASCSPATTPKPRRARTALPIAEFHRPLIETLHSLGGRARPDEVRPRMEARMKAVTGPDDCEASANGEPRWWEATRRAREELERQGYIQSESQPGVWTLSDRGKDRAKAWAGSRNPDFIEYLATMPDVGEDEDFERYSS